MDATAKAGVSWSRPTLTHASLRHVVDAVRNRLAHRVAGEVVDAHPFGFTGRLPFAPTIREIPDQFLLLRVDRNHGLPTSRERRGGRVDVFELRVAVGVRRPFARLLQGVQAIAETVQELPDRGRAHRPPVRGQRAREFRGTLARPPQRRHRVAARQRFDQEVQRLGDPGLRILDAGAPRPGLANAGRRHAARQFAAPVPDRLAGQPGRRRDDRIAAEANRDRFGSGPQPSRALGEQRTHHHILRDESGFQVEVALHRTSVRSRNSYT
jgi:hypothetical protein